MNTTDPEVHSMTGAYACHALEPAERTAFERHLAQCATCAQEMAELQETTAILASAVAQTPPPRMKAAVDARIAMTRQTPPDAVHTPARQVAARPARRWFTALGWGLAAVVAVLGIRLGDQQHQINQARQRNDTISTLLSAPDTRTESVDVRTGRTGAVLVSRSRDEAAITINGLTKLSAGQAYQLWMIGPSGIRSGGVLPHRAEGTAGSLIANSLGDAQTIGLTVEPVGGSSHPTSTPVMLLPMPA